MGRIIGQSWSYNKRIVMEQSLSYLSKIMKNVSAERRKEIENFSAAVQAAARRLVPGQASDAERIRRVAEHLGAGSSAVKKWFYGQHSPRGGAAKALLQLIEQVGSQDDDVIDASKID